MPRALRSRGVCLEGANGAWDEGSGAGKTEAAASHG